MKLREVFFIFYTIFKNGEATDDEVRWLRNSLHQWSQQWWEKFISSD